MAHSNTPHMSTSRCGNICVKRGFSNRSCVEAAMSGRSCEQQCILWTTVCFVNLGEEVILTLLWQSGASESATVCFVIGLSICYWLLKCGVFRVVCVSERESHITATWERVTSQRRVCVRERESHHSVVCARVCERLVCKHIRASSLWLSRDFVPLSGLNWW